MINHYNNRTINKMCRFSLKQTSVAVISCMPIVLIIIVSCSPVSKKRDLIEQSFKVARLDGNELDSSKVQDSGDVDVLGLYNMFGGGNPSVTPDGSKLVEGDIVMPSIEDLLEQKKATPDSSVYWPNGEVVYTYHESINQQEMAVIEAAMQHWRQHTCITFRPRQATDYIFVRFRSDTPGCWSLVGRQADRIGQGQDVSIGQGCANLNVVVHEIGHVIGFYHEQSRSDRDQYIDIVWSNVLPGYALQFRKETDSNFNIPYDLTSTMQYPQWAFSKEIFEKSTIVAKNPAYQRFLSKNYPLSFRDRMLANQLYSCTNACSQVGAGSCQNGGYMRATGSPGSFGGFGQTQCSCDCPPNFQGVHCEQRIRDDYYSELPCGGLVSKPGTIKTPGYPHRNEPGQSCMWDIRAPAGKTISIKFNGFGFAPRFTKAGTKVINKCFNETVEIRLKSQNIYDGDTYCGTDIQPGTVLHSDGSRAVIIITANDKMYGQGLSASIRFRGPNGLGDEIGGDDDETDQEKGQSKPQTTSATTHRPETSTSVYTVAPPVVPIVVQTLPPIMPPQPPPSVVTTSSLLEEYEKESRKTLPPVIPMYRQ